MGNMVEGLNGFSIKGVHGILCALVSLSAVPSHNPQVVIR